MKKLITVVWCLCLVVSLQAQTWDEWFRQGRTAKKYLKEQVVALKVHLDVVNKGYRIAREGLTTIRDIKNGDFDQHREYFSSLSGMNPSIKNGSKGAAILSYGVKLLKGIPEALTKIASTPHLSRGEKAYLQSLLDRLLDNTISSRTELGELTTSGTLTMSDDERIGRMEKLYHSVLEDYRFFQTLKQQTATLIRQRAAEKQTLEQLHKLHGL